MKSLHLLQVFFWESANSFESAKIIVKRKLRNMAHLIKRYIVYRDMNYPEQARILKGILADILIDKENIFKATSHQQLLLIEARASRSYWQGFTVLSRCPLGWKRIYPHANDRWNIALNIGYTILNNYIQKRLCKHSLSLEIGMLHSPQKQNKALVYDFQELFRQSFVDSAVIPLFSRGKAEKIEDKQVIIAVFKAFESKIYYEHCWMSFQSVLDKEIRKYITAIRVGEVFVPYRHSWSHRNKKPTPYLR